jgi:hypothetical protein
MSAEFESVGEPMRGYGGARYYAEVQRAPSSDGNCRWRIMQDNPPNTVPIARVVAQGSVRSCEAAKSKAIEELVRLANAEPS